MEGTEKEWETLLHHLLSNGYDPDEYLNTMDNSNCYCRQEISRGISGRS